MNVTDGNCDATISDLSVIHIVACSLLLILSCVGNFLVLATVYRNCNMRNTVNYFIANLSISDMVTVVFPYKPARINKRTCLKLIICVWVLAGASSSYQVFSFKLAHHGTTVYCRYKGSLNTSLYFENMESYEVDNIVIFVFLTAIPLGLLVVTYACIVFALHCQGTSLQLAPDAVRQRAKENRKVTFLSLTIVAVFAAVWAPTWVLCFAKQYKGIIVNSCVLKALWSFTLYFPFTHCAINPLVYYKFNDNYRQGFKELIRSTLNCLFFRSGQSD